MVLQTYFWLVWMNCRGCGTITLMDEAQFIPMMETASNPINWTASEFIAHDKTAGWYGTLAGVAVLLAAIIFLLTRDAISSSVVVVGALLFGVYAARQPRQLPYSLSDHGLHVGSRFYPLQQFRSFSVVPEGAFSSIVFMPLKRFAPLTTIYYPPESEDQIVSILSTELPFAEHRHDAIERLMRRIRF